MGEEMDILSAIIDQRWLTFSMEQYHSFLLINNDGIDLIKLNLI